MLGAAAKQISEEEGNNRLAPSSTFDAAEAMAVWVLMPNCSYCHQQVLRKKALSKLLAFSSCIVTTTTSLMLGVESVQK